MINPTASTSRTYRSPFFYIHAETRTAPYRASHKMMAARQVELPFQSRKRMVPQRHAAKAAACKRSRPEDLADDSHPPAQRMRDEDLADSLAVLRRTGASGGRVNWFLKASSSEQHSFQGQQRRRWIGQNKNATLPGLELRESSIP